MVRECAGSKRDGSQCTATVNPPQTHCWWHDPANAEQRRRAASKAGKAKPNKAIASIKAQLQELVNEVREGSTERADAAVAGQLLNYLTRAITVELKIREVEDLEARLTALEEVLATQKQGGYGSRGA